MVEKYKSCPFCGSNKLEETLSVICRNCGARCNANLWNKRASHAAAIDMRERARQVAEEWIRYQDDIIAKTKADPALSYSGAQAIVERAKAKRGAALGIEAAIAARETEG